MVPLARAFLARGHDVAWAADGDVRRRLRDEGFDAMPAGLAEGVAYGAFEERYPEVIELAPPDRPDFMFQRLFGPIRAEPMLDDLLPIARDWNPSLLVSEQAELAGPVAAAVLGVPNLTHAFGSLLPERRLVGAAQEMAPLWEEHGLEPRPHAGTYDHLYLDIPAFRNALISLMTRLSAILVRSRSSAALCEISSKHAVMSASRTHS